VGKIVGKFEVKRINQDTPQMLWNKYSDCAGIVESEFFEYFKGVDSGYAIEIKNFQPCEPFNAEALIPNFQPPQSYIYVPKKEENANKLTDFLNDS
jgi:predicted transcriptional regulator